MLRNLFVIVLISIVLIVVLYVVVPATPLSETPFFIELRYLRGYPWVPAIILSVGLVSVSAAAGLSEKLKEWSADETIPNVIRLILKILMAADSRPLPDWAWGISVISSIVFLVLLWLFPRCITPNDILVTFSFEKGNVVIATPSQGEIAVIKPRRKYHLGVEVEPVTDGVDLPGLKCIWSKGTFHDDNLMPTTGCSVEYTSGEDSIPDPVSLQLFQRRCSSLGSYSFFVQGEQ